MAKKTITDDEKSSQNESGKEKAKRPDAGASKQAQEEAQATGILRDALLAPKPRKGKKAPVEPAALPSLEELSATPEPKVINAEQERQEKNELKKFTDFFDRLEKRPDSRHGFAVGDLFDRMKRHQTEISKDPDAQNRLFTFFLSADKSWREDMLLEGLRLGFKIPDTLKPKLATVINDLYSERNYTRIEELEGLLDNTIPFTEYARNRLFSTESDIFFKNEPHRGRGAVRVQVNFDPQTEMYVFKNAWNDPLVLSPNRAVAERVFAEIKSEETNRTFTDATDLLLFVENTILPRVLSTDEKTVADFLNARSAREISDLQHIPTTAIKEQPTVGARLVALREFRETIAQHDDAEKVELAKIQDRFQNGEIKAKDKALLEEGRRIHHDRSRERAEFNFTSRLQETFSRREQFVRDSLADGLLELKPTDDSRELKLGAAPGKQDALQDKAFDQAIEKQNKLFFKARPGEKPEAGRTRVLDDIKKKIKDRFIGLRKSQKKGDAEGVGLGRLFAGLFEGENNLADYGDSQPNSYFLESLLTDKAYIDSLLYVTAEEGDFGSPMKVTSDQADENFGFKEVWDRTGALKELVQLYRKNLGDKKTDYKVGYNLYTVLSDQIKEDVARDARNLKAGNLIGPRENFESRFFTAWINLAQQFGVDAALEEYKIGSAENIKKINPLHAIGFGGALGHGSEYLRLYENVLGSDAVKQMLMEAFVPELSEDKELQEAMINTEATHSELPLAKYLWGLAKAHGIADLRGARGMMREMKERAGGPADVTVWVSGRLEKANEALHEVYRAEIDAILEQALG